MGMFWSTVPWARPVKDSGCVSSLKGYLRSKANVQPSFKHRADGRWCYNGLRDEEVLCSGKGSYIPRGGYLTIETMKTN